MLAGDDATVLPQRFEALLGKLRADVAEATRVKESSPLPAHAKIVLMEGSLSLLELKEVNRRTQELVAAFKESSQKANQSVDKADLKLQNLQYEKNHFLREIKHCRGAPPASLPHACYALLDPRARHVPPSARNGARLPPLCPP